MVVIFSQHEYTSKNLLIRALKVKTVFELFSSDFGY